MATSIVHLSVLALAVVCVLTQTAGVHGDGLMRQERSPEPVRWPWSKKASAKVYPVAPAPAPGHAGPINGGIPLNQLHGNGGGRR